MNKRKKYWILTFVLVIDAMVFPIGFLESVFSATTHSNDYDIFWLEDLKAVHIQVVQPISGFEDKPKFNPVDITKLQTEIEHTLYEAGIEVVEGLSDDPEIGQLVVTVNVWKDHVFAKFIVQVKTELYQHAELVRDNRLQIMALTWPIGNKLTDFDTPMVVSRAELAKTIQDEVQQQIGIFINDYVEVNPELERNLDIARMMTGTIKYVINSKKSINLKRRFYIILGDNGKRYRPINLPREFEKRGLRVAFQAKEIRSLPGPDTSMWAISVEIIQIRKIEK